MTKIMAHGSFRIRYNDDFSGDALVSVPFHAIEDQNRDTTVVSIPVRLLEKLIIEKIRRNMIKRLEEMSDEELTDMLAS